MNHLSSTTSTLVNRTLTLDDWRIAIFNACQTGDLYEVIDLIDGAFTGTTAITDTRRDGQPLLMPIEVSIDFVVVRTDGPTQMIQGAATPLLVAIESNHSKVVRYLLEKGASVNYPIVPLDITPLFAAVKTRSLDMVRLLVEEYFVDVNYCSADGQNALFLALSGSSLDIVKYLTLSCASNLNFVSKDGKHSALSVAALSAVAGSGMVQYLVDTFGFDPHETNELGDNILMSACISGNLQLVQYAAEAIGIDVNLKNKAGVTALSKACTFGHKLIVQYLISQYNADLFASNAFLASMRMMRLPIAEYLVTDCKVDPRKPLLGGAAACHILAQEQHVAAILWMLDRGYISIDDQNEEDGNTIFMYAAHKNNILLVRALLGHHQRLNVNQQNKTGSTALMAAASGQGLPTVEWILKSRPDVNLQAVDLKGRTALWYAGSIGHVQIMQALIKAKAEFNIPDAEGVTPLMIAAHNGHLDAVRFLVDSRADVNLQHKFGLTALAIAVQKGHLPIVQFLLRAGRASTALLDHDGIDVVQNAIRFKHLDILKFFVEDIPNAINLNHINKKGASGFMMACETGYLPIVKYLAEELVELDVNRQLPEGGYTALWLAVERGHQDVVAYLIERCNAGLYYKNLHGYECIWGAVEKNQIGTFKYLVEKGKMNPSQINEATGVSMMFLAAQNGHVELVRLLHQYDPSLMEKPIKLGPTPIWTACSNGHLSVVEFLISAGASLQVSDNQGITPAVAAVQHGHLAVVKYLIENKLQNAEFKMKNGTSLFWIASENGQLPVVKYLVEQVHVNVQNKNKEGFGAAWIAAHRGKLEVVEYLLDNKLFDVNETLMGGISILYLSAQDGHLPLVKLLAERGKIDVNRISNDGFSAIWIACQRGHLQVVKYLKDRGARLDYICKSGTTAIWQAVLHNQMEVVQYLIDECKQDPQQKLGGGMTFVWAAAQNGHLGMVKYFTEVHKVDPSLCDVRGINAFWKAAEMGHLDVMKYLYDKYKLNPNQTTKTGWSPLFIATKQGHIKIVEYLVNCLHVNLHDPNNMDGSTSWLIAAQNGHLAILEILLLQHRKNKVSSKNKRNGQDANDLQINSQNVFGVTALMVAAHGNHLSVVKYLVETCGMRVNHQSKEEFTALWLACELGHLQTIRYLIEECNANPYLTPKNKVLPVQIALTKNHHDVGQYLTTKMQQYSKNYYDEKAKDELTSDAESGNNDVLVINTTESSKLVEEVSAAIIDENHQVNFADSEVSVQEVASESHNTITSNELSTSHSNVEVDVIDSINNDIIDAIESLPSIGIDESVEGPEKGRELSGFVESIQVEAIENNSSSEKESGQNVISELQESPLQKAPPAVNTPSSLIDTKLMILWIASVLLAFCVGIAIGSQNKLTM